MKQRIRDFLFYTYSLAPESLALFRIGMALMLLSIIVSLLPYSDMLLGHNGVIPTAWLIKRKLFFLHGLVDNPVYTAVLYGFQILAALCLLVGYRTRTATIICWLLLMSMQNRNGLILHSGDILLKLMLFWGMFMPLGNYFSVDAHQWKEKPDTGKPVFTVAGLGLLLQVAIVYGLAAYFKKDPMWRSTGEALYYALNVDYITLPAGKWMLGLPAEVLSKLSLGVFYLEFLTPALLLNPFFSGPLRSGMIGLLIVMHLGFVPTLNIGFFPWIDIVALVALLPVWFWRHDIFPARFMRGFLNRVDVLLAGLSEKLPSFRLQLPEFMQHRTRRIASMIAAFFIVLMLACNIEKVYPELRMSKPYYLFARDMGFEQNWAIFAPTPPTEDGWLVVSAKFRNAHEKPAVDLFTGLPLRWEKPDDMIAFYKSDRIWKYVVNITNCPDNPSLHKFGDYLCREWEKKDKAVERMEIFMMREKTLPGFKTEVHKASLGTHVCKR